MNHPNYPTTDTPLDWAEAFVEAAAQDSDLIIDTTRLSDWFSEIFNRGRESLHLCADCMRSKNWKPEDDNCQRCHKVRSQNIFYDMYVCNECCREMGYTGKLYP